MKSVHDFIIRFIDSVEQLEVLLLLRSDRSRNWGADEVSTTLRSHQESVKARLEGLAGHGLIERVDGTPVPTYRCRVLEASLESQIESLSEAYAQKRFSIINMIYTGQETLPLQSKTSVRKRNLQSLADAFKLNEEDK